MAAVQTQGIAQMVKYAISTYQANSNRVYVTGTSCGGEMTEALLGVYPDIFKAGPHELSGVPVGRGAGLQLRIRRRNGETSLALPIRDIRASTPRPALAWHGGWHHQLH